MDSISLPPILLDIPRNAVVAIGLPLVFGSLSGYPTKDVVRGPWYMSLRRPRVEPPRAAFGIVWPILYASMGWASHLAIRAYDQSLSPSSRMDAYAGLKLYWIQLGLNLAWTPLFFMAKQKGLALLDILPLTGVVYWMTYTLHHATNGATTLFLAPYCAWLTFASYLNFEFWYLNRGRPELKEF
ncbi:SubName: Full=Related to Peripheral-type benzodiazepine receptor {ECO:0000313/EMBL:CCA70660.1} [Serendipita indica DSM 11827]|uniref:Related to Peripheral-type benzodiazepine receptor n=1 Tax=Serendipita indica (strain DSM 11827) TaxID=1109443 RepID=G4TH67_SERID|nr:SubName: Full=Related to Peripheral-type benzodiazepine receptor {ECO:0000313/EMBL:CCA70660.1} [Serendipita indica DSM 11827]CCA70660.1 related to Peripheral-type benzodiazepine receptor [Serendipita indica DSM 11827]